LATCSIVSKHGPRWAQCKERIMIDVAVIDTAVEKVVQKSDPKAIADELVGLIRPLLLSHNTLELDVKHQVGVLLNARLEPDGQKRLPYGGKVMARLSELLNVSRSVLDRTRQFARQYKTLADFKAQHPNVTTWEQVKKVLVQSSKAKPNSTSQPQTDLAAAFWKQYARSLDTLLTKSAMAPHSADATIVEECQRKAQALTAKLEEHLSILSTVTQDSPEAKPFQVEGDTQLDSVALSTAG